ncbi:O-antigen polysaccharide polymerase Wzy [Collimonas antrihumi]|uniref:O-antigen polysaccharide polymerase Wzy n=1 Tax=Collimonas antrihumi TaxID=1940615 RepID=UPI001B8C0D7B|nr:O-antigen polysaccharide polymerase Wzy [Collimonas antrihumi]
MNTSKIKSNSAPPIYSILLFFILITILILNIGNKSIIFIGSELLILFSIIFQWNEFFKCKYPSLSDATVFCFTILFFYIAPILQLNVVANILINTSPYNDTFGSYANLLSSLFMFTYVLTRKFSRADASKKILNNVKYDIERPRNIFLLFLLFLIISVLAAFLAYKDIQIKAIAIDDADSISIQDLFVNKVLYFFPYGFLALTIIYKESLQKFKGLFWLLLVSATICLLICKNPLLEKRNALGPIYISILYLWNQKIHNSKKLTLFTLLSIIVIFFPLSSMFTHVKFDDWSFDSNELYKVISSHFLELHYDAWANFHTVIEIVNGQNGFLYGRQLLGSILFFIPRSLWPDKALATGNFIGNYLSVNHSMWFNNLSSPLISEAYLDFGLIGVLAYAYFLGRLTIFLDKLSFSTKSWERIAGIFFAVYLFYVLRGSLMVAIAYGTGSIIVFITIHLLNRRNSKANRILIRKQENGFFFK